MAAGKGSTPSQPCTAAATEGEWTVRLHAAEPPDVKSDIAYLTNKRLENPNGIREPFSCALVAVLTCS